MELTKRSNGTDWEAEAATAQSILFKMGSEYYGLSIALVREIIKPLPITRFPSRLCTWKASSTCAGGFCRS